MSVGRLVRNLVALVVIVVVAVALGPTIWDNALINLETYLGVRPEVGKVVLTALAAAIVVVLAIVRTVRWIRIWRHHRAARHEAVRRLQA
jgi:small-conductance mechanosensitive channel